MIGQLDPQHDYIGSFRAEVSRLAANFLSLERIKEKTGKFAHELERFTNDAPGDTRRVLRRLAEGNIGRLQVPGLESVGDRISRGLARLTIAVIASAHIAGGSMLLIARLDGWLHVLGELMLVADILEALIVGISALRRGHGRRQ